MFEVSYEYTTMLGNMRTHMRSSHVVPNEALAKKMEAELRSSGVTEIVLEPYVFRAPSFFAALERMRQGLVEYPPLT